MKTRIQWQKSDQWFPGNRQQLGRDRRERLQGSVRKLLGAMVMFIIVTVVVVSRVQIYVKTDQSVYFKYVQFTVWQLYFNKAVF